MALSATDLYVKHKEDHDLEFTREEGSDGKGDPLNVHEFHLTRWVEESKAINDVKKPCIIISASGMISGGRVLHHLVQRLPDPRNAVILAGFQAEGTRGRALQEGAKSLKIYGQDVPVGAEIVEMGQFSAHAGKSELLRWLTALGARVSDGQFGLWDSPGTWAEPAQAPNPPQTWESARPCPSGSAPNRLE